MSEAMISQQRGPEALVQQAAQLQSRGRLWEAEQLLRAALNADDKHFAAAYGLGLIHLQQRKFAEATSCFQQATRLDKRSSDARFHLGVALSGTQQLEEAVRQYRKALALRPAFPEAHNNLGHALQLLGRHEDAVGHYEKALVLLPDYPEALNNLGNSLAVLDRCDEAVAKYEKALSIRSNYVEARTSLGNALVTLGKHEEAVSHFEFALSMQPKHIDAHIGLAKTLGVLARYSEAIAQFEKALAIDPDNVEARARLGSLLQLLGKSEEALAQCRRAIEIDANHVEALNLMGDALRALGNIDDAVRAFEKAISLAPRKSGAYLNLATSRRMTANDPAFVAMRELAKDMASLDVRDQTALHFALGKAFGDIGDTPQSFRHVLRGNALKRAQITYDEARTLARFARIRTTFTAELMHDKRGLGHPSQVPVFIIGLPRSGTTLIEQILASHPEVHGAGELYEFAELVAAISGPDATSFPEAVAAMSGAQLHALGEAYAQSVIRRAPQARRITDKMPSNLDFVGLIHLALPNARIIHSIRDPRDTALSCFSILFTHGQEHSYDLAELGRHVRACQRLVEHWRKVLPPGAMLEVNYEDVVDDVEAQARRIVAHCGLPWHDACLDFHKAQRAVHTASVAQVRQPIYRSSIGRWREFENELQPLLRELEAS
jgi:tetratricopeptide (TPR) repeat protein